MVLALNCLDCCQEVGVVITLRVEKAIFTEYALNHILFSVRDPRCWLSPCWMFCRFCAFSCRFNDRLCKCKSRQRLGQLLGINILAVLRAHLCADSCYCVLCLFVSLLLKWWWWTCWNWPYSE